jgi:outer membrane protein assembly factor BamA
MLRVIVPGCLFMVALHLGCCAAPCAARGIDGNQARSDSLRQPRSSFVILPYAYYTPETKIAFGAGSIYSFRSADSPTTDRPSSVRAALTYTQLNQMILALLPEIYLQKERYYYSGFYGYYRYPDTFWGIGGDTPDGAKENYRSNDFESNTTIQRQILPGLFVGPLLQYQYMKVNETSPRGVLQAGAIPGSRGGSASGLGVIVRHDTRDHVYQPSAGFYNQCSAVSFGRAIGSDYTFNVLSIDLRMYRAVFGSHVLAFQTYDSFISGEAPFQMLGRLGGSYRMRGYYLGRYRDSNMITAQAEYRFPVWWRFGAVGFAGVGDVEGDARKFRIDRFRYSLGCGVRFMFDTREKINARLDIGFGDGDNAGVYAMVLEAF